MGIRHTQRKASPEVYSPCAGNVGRNAAADVVPAEGGHFVTLATGMPGSARAVSPSGPARLELDEMYGLRSA
jgi:hypothetical protein